ncbi:MAG: DUF47 family protein [Candidatus Bathyarchaeota archaeon]|nr:DUF47 family protein [Candidatus Bathyarchaeota archaeon]
MKRLKGIFVVGEKTIFTELIQILDVASQANTLMQAMFEAGYSDASLAENVRAMRTLERQADEITFKLGEEITGGAISPNIIDNLIEAVQAADDIVDIYYYLARELFRLSKAASTGFEVQPEKDWTAVYENLFDFADQMLSKLKQMLSTDSVPQILRLHKEIEALEEQGDDVKDGGYDKLYTAAPKMHFLQFHHHTEMLHKTDDILDNCEDLSDMIVSVVTSILK